MRGNSKSETRNPKRCAFTMTELLVVIAIMLFIAGLLLPSLRGAREKARRTECLNNLKQIGIAMHAYAMVYDEWFPYPTPTNTISAWTVLMDKKFLSSYAIWICPTDRMRGFASQGSAAVFGTTNCSYAYGGFGMSQDVQPDMPLAADRQTCQAWTNTAPYCGANLLTHKSEGGNVLFADGRVTWVRGLPSCDRLTLPMSAGQNP